MSLRCKLFRLCIMALCMGITLPSIASAASGAWPQSTIKVIVPFTAGGGVDLIARIVAPELSKILGVAVVMENSPGASGTIGMNKLAAAKPDGYTIAFTSEGPCVMSPHFSNVGYGTKEFAPIAQVIHQANVFYVNKADGIKTLQEVLAKGEKEAVSVGVPGVYGSARLMLEILMDTVNKPGIIAPVPFGGGAEAMAALLAGKITAGCSGQADPMAYIKNGSFVALAIASAERDPAYPDVPTLTELGYPIESGVWFGYAAPAGTPPAVIAELDAAVAQAVKQPHVQEAISKLGTSVKYLNAEAFTEKWHKGYAFTKDAIAKLGIK